MTKETEPDGLNVPSKSKRDDWDARKELWREVDVGGGVCSKIGILHEKKKEKNWSDRSRKD